VPNKNTLLSLISGGRFKTSRDLPTIPEMAHSYIDQIIESYGQGAGTERKIVGEGLGLLEMVGPKLGLAALASPKKIIDTWRGVISKNKSVLETLQESLITIKKSNLPDLQKQEMVQQVGINAEALIRESGKQRQNIKSFEKFYDLMYPWSKKITKK